MLFELEQAWIDALENYTESMVLFAFIYITIDQIQMPSSEVIFLPSLEPDLAEGEGEEEAKVPRDQPQPGHADERTRIRSDSAISQKD